MPQRKTPVSDSPATPRRRPTRAAPLASAPPAKTAPPSSAPRSFAVSNPKSYLFEFVFAALLTVILIGGNIFLILSSPIFMKDFRRVTPAFTERLCTDWLDNKKEEPSGTVCPEIYQPVCGETSVQCFRAPCPNIKNTYSNRCLALASGAVNIKDGACEDAMPAATLDITSPRVGATITTPVTIQGSAPGPWFFEASFPIDIVDSQKRVIGQGYAQADGEWMTTGQVPFTAKVTFKKGTEKSGYIIFKKDNPSGLPQHNASFELPVKF